MKNCQIITTCEVQWRQRLVGQCGQGGKVNALLDNEWIFKLKMVENNLLLGLESWHFSSGFMRWDIAGPLKYSWLSSLCSEQSRSNWQWKSNKSTILFVSMLEIYLCFIKYSYDVHLLTLILSFHNIKRSIWLAISIK